MNEFSIIDVEPCPSGGFYYGGASGLTAREVADRVYEDLMAYEPPPPRTTPLTKMELDYIKMLTDPKYDPWRNLLGKDPTRKSIRQRASRMAIADNPSQS